MTARAELFVDEDIRDFIGMEKFDDLFGDEWCIDASHFDGDESSLPQKGECNIINDDGNIIGVMKFKLKFVVEGDGADKCIGVEIVDATIKKIKVK